MKDEQAQGERKKDKEMYRRERRTMKDEYLSPCTRINIDKYIANLFFTATLDIFHTIDK